MDIRLQHTRYGYRTEIRGVDWQLRRMVDGRTFAVYTHDAAYEDTPHFYGDLNDARVYLNGIAAGEADVFWAQETGPVPIEAQETGPAPWRSGAPAEMPTSPRMKAAMAAVEARNVKD